MEENIKKILVAEDNEINQKLIQIILIKLNYKFDFVLNGEQAVNIYDPSKYDMIFMDLHMPVMDGFEATKIIKKKYHDSKIIAISAEFFPETMEKCRAIGIDDFINKPFKIEDIRKVIEKYVN